MDEYLIWSNKHRGWWRPAKRGYSQGLDDAGIYSREDALRICQDSLPDGAHVGYMSTIPVRRADLTEFMEGRFIPHVVLVGEQ